MTDTLVRPVRLVRRPATAYERFTVGMAFVVRRGAAAVRDPLKRSRLRWFSLGWIIAIPTIVLGGAFALTGDRVLLSKGAFAIYGRIPGGLHLHGVIMVTLGVALVAGLGASMLGYPEKWDFLRPLLRVIFCYYAWSLILFAMAPAVQGGEFSLFAVLMWGAISFLPLVLLIGPPPPLVPHDETDLIRAAVSVGISPAQARALSGVYFGGSNVTPG